MSEIPGAIGVELHFHFDSPLSGLTVTSQTREINGAVATADLPRWVAALADCTITLRRMFASDDPRGRHADYGWVILTGQLNGVPVRVTAADWYADLPGDTAGDSRLLDRLPSALAHQ